MPSDPLVHAEPARANPAELVEIATRFGPPTIFAIDVIEPHLLTEGWRLLPHVGIELRECYQVLSTGTPHCHLVAEAVTSTRPHGMLASVVALGVGMDRTIGDYPLPAGMTVGDAVHQHWRALEIR